MVLDPLGHFKFHNAFSYLVHMEKKRYFPRKNALWTPYRNLVTVSSEILEFQEVNLTSYEHNQNAGSESCICLFMP